SLVGGADAARLGFALDDAGPFGLDQATLPLVTGLGTAALAAARAAGGATIERHGARWFSRAARATATDRLLAALNAHHAAAPLQPGLSLEAARRALEPTHPALIEAVIATACEAGEVVRRGTALARAGHTAAAGVADRRLLERLRAAYIEAGLEPPELAALSDALGADLARLRDLQRHLEREGELVRLASDWYADAAAVGRAERALVAHLGRMGPADTSACKALFGVSRKYLIPLLEHFDRQGVTRREGNQRVLAAPASCP
ncbi:MAG: SelB C-terminal domain-containing protein, partial [Gemmatimonadota bacterium]